jgi:hypothetical protein
MPQTNFNSKLFNILWDNKKVPIPNKAPKKTNISQFILNSIISNIGNYIVKRTLATTWWGTIILFGYEALNKSPVIDHIKNIFISEPVGVNIMPIVPQQILQESSQEMIRSDYSISGEIVKEIINQEIANPTTSNFWINLIFEGGIICAAGSVLFLISAGPAATASVAIGGAANLLCSAAIPASLPPAIALTIPKIVWLGTTIGIHALFSKNNWIPDNWDNNDPK